MHFERVGPKATPLGSTGNAHATRKWGGGGTRLTAFETVGQPLLTGGAGFLGSWLVRKLLLRGADVVCLVREHLLGSEIIRHDLLSRVKVVSGDIRDQTYLESVLKENSIATLFHLAAQAIVSRANANPAVWTSSFQARSLC